MMYSALLAVVGLFATAAVAQDGVTIDSPASITTCQNILLTFQGGTPPYILSAIPADDISGVIEEIAQNVNGNSYSWNVNLPAGTNVTIKIADQPGSLNYAHWLVVLAGTDTSCVGQTTSPSGTSAAGSASAPAPSTTAAVSTPAGSSSAPAVSTTAAASSAAAPSSSAAVTSPAASTTRAASSSASRASAASSGSSAAPSSSSPASSAPTNVAQWAAAGIVGVLGAAALL